MAKIILNVELNKGNLNKDLQQIQTQIKGLSLGKSAATEVNTLQKSYANLLSTLKNAKNKYPTETFSELETQIRACLTSVKGLNAEMGNTAPSEKQKAALSKLSVKYKELSAQFATMRAETEQVNTAVIKSGDSLMAMAQKFFKWQVVATLVMKPLRALSDAWKDLNETLVETEKRVIEIQRVINESVSDEQVANKLYDLAIQYGRTFDDVSQIALNFARAGMSWNDSIKATEAAVLALNVAELDATEASDGMIAIMTQFGISADKLVDIVDMLNITADNAAVTTEKLLTALQRTGSSAKNAGLELEDTVSIITALSEATGRSGENLGTAVNSLIQFSTKATALDKFAQLSDNMASIVQNYRMGQGNVMDIWKGLSAEIGNRQNAQNVLGSLFQEDDWSELNKQLQAELGDTFAEVTEIYDTASTFRKNYFIALLNNMDKVQEAMDTMQDSAGYSAKENEKYLDTYEAKTNALTSKWEKFLNSEQGWLGIKKTLVDIASVLLDIWDALGGIWAILPTLFVAIIAFKGAAILSSLQTLAKTLWSFVTGIIPSAIAAWKAFALQQISLSAAMQASLPIIGILALVISGIVTAVNKYKQAQEEAATQALESWKSVSDTATKLTSLSEKYEKLEKGTKDYLSTEEALVNLLSDKHKNVLKDLTAGTEEYRQALLALSKQEREEYEQQLQRAKLSAEKKLAESNVAGNKSGLLFEKDTFDVLEDIGAYRKDKYLTRAGFLDIASFGDKLSKESTAEAQYNNYKVLSELADEIYNQAKFFTGIGDIEMAEGLLEKWNTIQMYLDRARDTVKDYEETQKSLADLAEEITDEEKKQGEATDYIKKNISEIGKTLRDQVVAALKDARDLTKETYDFEEKKKNVIEAEQALLEAKQERNVRVFNGETGMWEYQANEKSIQDAEEKLADAQKAVEDAAWNEVIDSIDSGNATNEKILEIIAKWATAYGSGDFSGLRDEILGIIYDETGISIRGKTSTDGDSNDRINPRPPMVRNPPSRLMSALAAPVDNNTSRARRRAAGLHSGAISEIPTSNPAITSNSTTNTDNSRSYYVGDVLLSREVAEQMSFADVIEAVAEQS